MHHIEAYTAEGVMSGSAIESPGHGRDDADPPLVGVDRAIWHPLAGGASVRRGRVDLEPDDVLIVCADSEEPPIFARWHAVELETGPYRVSGELPSVPGFDPGRSLARPGGQFVSLRDVRIALAGNPDGGFVECAYALINRYAVERIVADIDLGVYFPGTGHVIAAERSAV